MPGTDSTDDDLLARLNALKKSSVTLDTTYNASVAPASPPKPTDDLAARFARLGSASPIGSPQPTSSSTDKAPGAPVVAPGASNYLEGIAQGVGGSNVEFNEEDEKSLEELLGELNGTMGERKDWDMSKAEQEDVGKLLKDMRKILPQVVNDRSKQDARADSARPGQGKDDEFADWETIEVNVGGGDVQAKQDDDEDDGDEEAKKKTEDDEADDVIAKVMAELEISRKYDPPSPPSPATHEPGPGSKDGNNRTEHDAENTGDDGDEGGLSLPSAPKDLPEDDFTRTQAIEDAFTARLAALSAPTPQTDSLGLPSAPSFAPHKKPAVSANLQKHIDEEIDTWCIICQDDATLRCLGCDDDLYCQNCWMEGHRGESAGFEERRHKAVLYTKSKKKKAVAAS